MKSIKIPDGQHAEVAIRNHALATFSGCRELFYEVPTPTFDEIWMRTGTQVGRGTSRPRLVLECGRHQVTAIAIAGSVAAALGLVAIAPEEWIAGAPTEPEAPMAGPAQEARIRELESALREAVETVEEIAVHGDRLGPPEDDPDWKRAQRWRAVVDGLPRNERK